MKEKIFAAITALVIVGAVVLINTRLDAQNPNSRRVTPISAELAYGAMGVTGATGASGAVTLYTLTEDCGILSFENTTNVEIDLLIGSTKKRIPATSFRVYDLVTNYTRWASGTVLKVFAPTAPSSGYFEVLCNPQ